MYYPRVRLRSSPDVGPYGSSSSIIYESPPGSWHESPPSVGSFTTVKNLKKEVMSDFPNNGIKYRSYPERTCRHEAITFESYPTVCTRVDPDSRQVIRAPGVYFEPLTESIPWPHADVPTLPDLALDRLESLDPTASAWAGMPFLGELHSCVQMIENPLSFLSKLRVPKGMQHNPLGQVLCKLGLDRASNAWLQYKYGWKPLFSDLKTVATLIGSMSSQYQRYLDGSSLAEHEKLSAAFPLRYPTGAGRQAWSFEGSVSVKADLKYRIRPAAQTGYVLSYPNYVASRMGFSIGEIASTVWELTPYSFVADWFIPVGQTLNRLTHTAASFEILRNSYHYTHRSRAKRFWWSDAEYAGVIGSKDPIHIWSADRRFYARSDPDFQPGSLPSSTGMSTQRYISALSLIAQRLMFPISRR